MSAACPSILFVICMIGPHILSSAGHAVTGDFLGTLANGIQDAVSWIFTNTTTFWLRTPSPDLANEPAITAMRQWLLPITAAVAVGGVLAAGLRMVLTRRANPLLDVGTGLAAIAAAATLGVAVPNLLLQAGDTWTGWVLNVSTGGQFSSRLSDILAAGVAPDVIVIIFGMLALVMGALQAALLVFRQAAVIILAAILPLAAAGATAPLTRAWIRKIVSWMLALIMYKPAAAAVYAAAFTMIGKGANLQTLLMGFVMLALSLLALPVLMRFFTWTTGAVSSGGGGGGALIAGAASGAAAMSSLRGSSGSASSTSASEHASYLAAQQQSPQAGAAGQGATTGTPTVPGTESPAGTGNGAGTTRTTSPGGEKAAGPADSTASAGSPGGGTGGASGAGTAGATDPGAVAGNAGVGIAGGAAAGGTVAGGAAGAAAAGGAAAATGGLAGVVYTAAQAAKGLADGARDAADSAIEDGEQR